MRHRETGKQNTEIRYIHNGDKFGKCAREEKIRKHEANTSEGHQTMFSKTRTKKQK